MGESSFVISSRSVPVEASSWPLLMACSTAWAGVDVVEKRPLIRTLVLVTTWSGFIASQELGQPFVGESACGRSSGDVVPEIEKRLADSCTSDLGQGAGGPGLALQKPPRPVQIRAAPPINKLMDMRLVFKV